MTNEEYLDNINRLADARSLVMAQRNRARANLRKIVEGLLDEDGHPLEDLPENRDQAVLVIGRDRRLRCWYAGVYELVVEDEADWEARAPLPPEVAALVLSEKTPPSK